MEIVDLNNKSTQNLLTNGVGIALGNFDGLHRGHIKLLKNMIEGSKNRNLKTAVLLFTNHTKFLLDSGKKIKILSSNREKIKILKNIGIDFVFFIDFNEDLMKLSGYEFIKNILVEKMNVKYITVGFDYRFGYRAENTSKDLYNLSKEFGIETNIIDPIYVEDRLISSTLIRNLISEGDIKNANNYLGRPYRIRGRVVHGKKRGHALGFPTANINLSEPFILPKIGVYYTRVVIDGIEYRSLTNIGYNPTFNDEDLTIETYILNFNKYIYDQEIDIEFISYIRDDIKFSSEEDLIEQMKLDLEHIK